MVLEPFISQLSRDEAAVLRLRRAGHPDTLIADALGIGVERVPVAVQHASAALVHVAVASANAQR